jgi:hypothetical protein
MSRSVFMEWERALCRRFLSAEGDDAGPIRSFELTPATLSASRPGLFLDDNSAVASFRNAMRFEDICSAVEHAEYRRLDEEGLPGCFTYLALTLYVDSLMEEDAGNEGAFRAKLASFLDADRSFSNLSGIAKMWVELQSWLEARAGKDGSYRQLVLPNAGGWKQIGYTARLSFPSRRDKGFLRRFLQKYRDPLASPAAFIANFRNEVASPNASFALKQAFEEFRTQFLSGRRALAGHRFWSFVQAVARGAEASRQPVQLIFDIARDQDETWMASLYISASERANREQFNDLGSAVEKAGAIAAHELITPVDRGFLVFRQIANATWRATSDVSACRGRVIVGLSSSARLQIAARLGPLEQSGTWFLTREPVSVGKVEEAARLLGMKVERPDFIVPITISDGVRTGGFWLGRAPFLPQISTDDADALCVSAESGAIGTVCCASVERASGVFRLLAAGPVDGNYLISPAASDAGAGRLWSRRVRFVADALVHDAPGFAGPASPLVEWDGEVSPPQTVLEFEPSWDETRTPADDLVEAVYAGGRSGWNEMDVVSLVRTGLGERVNPWDLLRSLQEAGCIEPVLRAQWRGRVWNLGRPALTTFESKLGPVVVLNGCIGAALATDFRTAAKAAGARPFRRRGVSDFAPTLFGCLDADAKGLAQVLGWPIRNDPMRAGGRLAFRRTERRLELYKLSHRWSWSAGRFIEASGRSAGPVSLERWIHRGGRDHDVYVVVDGSQTWHLMSRPAAVVLAHSLAGTPLFELASGMLRRIGREGALPDVLAAVSRIRHLANAGPIDGVYAYRLDDQTLRNFSTALPNLMPILKDSSGKGVVEAVSLAIHSGGRVRTTWSKGGLSTTHS